MPKTVLDQTTFSEHYVWASMHTIHNESVSVPIVLATLVLRCYETWYQLTVDRSEHHKWTES